MTVNVVTLVGEGLAASVVEAVAEALHQAGGRVEPARWLAAELACDLVFDGLAPKVAEAHVRVLLEGERVDVAAQPVSGRRKRLLVADMESTVIRNEMLDELADFVGQRPEVERITARAMAGELDFASALRARVKLLAGLGEEVLGQVMGRMEIDPGASQLVATMRAHGGFAALVSGGFTVFGEEVGRRLGFDVCRANALAVVDGKLTGGVVDPILGRDAKVEVLRELCGRLGIEPIAAAAVGDGANDLGMLVAAGLGVAFHAKPKVIAAARYSVRYGDLRTLLFFQGYARSEFSPV